MFSAGVNLSRLCSGGCDDAGVAAVNSDAGFATVSFDSESESESDDDKVNNKDDDEAEDECEGDGGSNCDVIAAVV